MTEHPPEAPRTQLFVAWSLINLLLAVAAVGVTLWALVQERKLRSELVHLTSERDHRCGQQVAVAPPPPTSPEARPPPPQDRPKSGYIGASGTDILPAMRVKLEALRAGATPDQLPNQIMLGSPDVLPANTIHVVNLWATWCNPCLDELPDFKALFARRSDWGTQVRFVPIQVKDSSAPNMAYRDRQRDMPRAPFMLADRGMNDPLVSALTADQQNKLFEGNLPVTLILDCNRRVRWAQFEQLSSVDFSELEAYVDRFRQELADDSPDAWCSQVWPGNGRCEGLENTAKFHSLEDCGELPRRPGEPDTAPVEPPPPAPEPCPDGKIRTADGKCTRKLHGDFKAPTKKPEQTTCGNDKCDAGETSASCCLDCPCDPPLVCRFTREGTSKCISKLKL